MPVLVPMTEDEFAGWVARAVAAYAADKVAAGQWSNEDALARAKRSLEELLPNGLSTPENRLYTIVDTQATAVGVLWIAFQNRAGERVAYVYDLLIKPEHQRKGHASRAFRALEDEARSLGLSGIALHVFGHNPRAIALYTKLGFHPTNISMYKPVGRAGA